MPTVKLSASVMTHPRRLAAAHQLRDRHPDLDLKVAVDPEPDKGPAPLRTALLAWRMMAEDATHHLVLQDDVVLCEDFRAVVERAVASLPTAPLALFTEWGSRSGHLVRLAALRGVSWVPFIDAFAPAQALVLPQALVHGFLDWCRGSDQGDDDALAVAAYLQSMDAPMYIPVCNLVEHTTTPSLLGNDLIMGPRHATCFSPVLARGHRWSAQVMAVPPVVPHFSTMQGRSVCCFRNGSSDGGWTTVPTIAWLRDNGFPLSAYHPKFLAARAGTKRAEHEVSEVLLLEIYLTAFGYGLVLAADPEMDEAWLADALSLPLVQVSLPTLVAGGLRRILPLDALHALAQNSVPLLHAAIQDGFAAGRAQSLLPVTAGPPC
jgi:hypothetical protein